MGRLGLGLSRDRYLFFALASLGVLALCPRYVVLARYLVERVLLGHTVGKPETADLPFVPNILPVFLLLFLVTFFMEHRWRLATLLLASLPIGLLFDSRMDLFSLAAYPVFLAAVLGVIRLPIRRSLAATIVCGMSVGFVALCVHWSAAADSRITPLAMAQTTFTPMLWYSVYEHLPPKRTLRARRFAIYHYCRFFGCPVIAYADLYSSPTRSLARIRFDGLKALYVAVFSAMAVWGAARLQAQFDPAGLSGLPLLAVSYVLYVGAYCKTAIVFNVFIGLARLFGFPVRDNFNYWLLARTPNDHWRRWNILFREWIVTFVFFPIMRAKRWLFVALMASLMTSGALHVVPQLLTDPSDHFALGMQAAYWFVNGLAIYAVVKFPQLFPRTIKRLRLDTHPLWPIVGVVATSAFYAILIGAMESGSWSNAGDYLLRLIGLRAGGGS
jgi:hypothetical protein